MSECNGKLEWESLAGVFVYTEQRTGHRTRKVGRWRCPECGAAGEADLPAGGGRGEHHREVVPSADRPIRLLRYIRGRSPIGRGAAQYGYEWVCPCGERDKTNEAKPKANGYALDHAVDAHGLPRRRAFVR